MIHSTDNRSDDESESTPPELVDPRCQSDSLRRRYGKDRSIQDLRDTEDAPPGWAEP